MKKEVVLGFMITLIVVSMLVLAFNIQLVKASGTVYIRAGGSVDPPTAPIQRDGDVYTLTDNIYDSIVVERDSIVVDGADHTLQGTGALFSKGISLSLRSNITIKNMEIKAFDNGIWLSHSSNNSVVGNNITSCTSGIYLYYSSDNTVSGNNITDNGNGIHLRYSSNNNTVSGNNITNNNYGLYFYHSSSFNSISGNNITNNEYYGVRFESSSNNTVFGNNITNNNGALRHLRSSNNTHSGNILNNNTRNFNIEGDELSHFMHTIDVSNLVNGKPVYYLVNQTGLVISPATHPQVGYLALINCVNITVKWLTLNNVGEGVLLAYTDNSTITNNNITNNWYGIWLSSFSNYNSIVGNTVTNNEYGLYFYGSSYNTIAANNITNNDFGIRLLASNRNGISGNNIAANNVDGVSLSSAYYNSIVGNTVTNNEWGLYFYGSSYNTISANNITANNLFGLLFGYGSPSNTIYHNNFVDNTEQAYCSDSTTSVWDDGYPSGGNYWSNYAGVDADGDGVGDTPYVVDANNQDNYPLMRIVSPIVGDVNAVGIVDIFDIAYVSAHWHPGPPVGPLGYDVYADINNDLAVDISDIEICNAHWGQTW